MLQRCLNAILSKVSLNNNSTSRTCKRIQNTIYDLEKILDAWKEVQSCFQLSETILEVI